MKKILIISNMYPSKEHVSFGIFVKNQVKALEKKGLNVVVAANNNPATGKKNVILKYMKWAVQVWKAARKNKNEISVTHAHYVFPSGIFSLWLKRKYNIPYIVTAHGGDIERMAKKGGKIRQWTQQILQEASHIVAVGPVLAQQIEHDFGIPKEKILICSMGVNRQVFQPANQLEARKQLNIQDDSFMYLFVGNVIKQKGVAELLQAFERVKQQVKQPVKLFVVGSRRDANFLSELSHYAQDDVVWVDPVLQPELVKYFQASDVFVLPSHIEGFGLVALEALATNTPVIASNVGGLPSLLGNGAGHLVEVKNVEALNAEMVTAFNEGKQAYYNTEAANEVFAIHDEQIITEQILRLYERALQKGNNNE